MGSIILAVIVGIIIGERLSTFAYQRKIEDFASDLVVMLAKNIPENK